MDDKKLSPPRISFEKKKKLAINSRVESWRAIRLIPHRYVAHGQPRTRSHVGEPDTPDAACPRGESRGNWFRALKTSPGGDPAARLSAREESAENNRLDRNLTG